VQVLAINNAGEITFVNTELENMIKIEGNELMGVNIGTIVAPKSISELRRMLTMVNPEMQDAVIEVEDDAAKQKEGGNEGNVSGSGSLTAQTSKQSSKDRDESYTDSTDKLNTERASSNKRESSASAFETETSTSEGLEPPTKKAKSAVNDESKASASATDEDAKLLLHYYTSDNKTGGDLKPPPELALGAASSTNEKSSHGDSMSETKLESSSASDSAADGYDCSREGSNGNSSSSLSNVGQRNEIVRWAVPLAPACIIAFVRRDGTKIWCELTASMRLWSRDLEVNQSSNASSSGESSGSDSDRTTNEVLICVRPITEKPSDSEIASYSQGSTKPDEADQKMPSK
jgi:hypothetical protein